MELLEREPLLERLAGLLAQSRAGRGRLALVAGEAGIGKTALVEAFCGARVRGAQTLWGTCDAVAPARPFAPLVDIADRVGGSLRAALEAGDRDGVLRAFLALLRRPGAPPRIVVLDDLHWADEATLDLLRVVGRRLRDTPALVVGAYRDDEVGPRHPLRLALGDLPAGVVVELSVPPLSREAVARLAAGTGLDAGALHSATAGNAFFVTEVVAAPGDTLPRTIRDAVMARLARLPPDAQELLTAAAVVGARVEPDLLRAVADRPDGALEACLEAGMLHREGGLVAFRHELARVAVLDAQAPAARARLHARVLDALRAGVVPADVVRLAQQAIEAGDPEAILALAPQAAERAAELGAHAEAADYLAVALAHRSAVDDRTRGRLLERYAVECSVSDRVAAARSAQEEAQSIWRGLGDRLREGDGLRALSTYMWLGGEGDRSRETAESAVSVLEPIRPHGHEMALALAIVAQRRLVATHDDVVTAAWARRALELAEQLGDEPVAIHATTTLAVAEIYLGVETGWARLEQALQRARAINHPEEITRALINIVEAARDFRRYEVADRYVDEARAFLEDREAHLYRHMLSSRIAELALERGRWDVAEREALDLLAETARSNQVRVRALEVIGRLRARRGEPGAWAALDEALAIVGPGELQEICPLHAARAETAWLEGDLARAGDEAAAGIDLASSAGAAWWLGELSFWAWRAGRLERLPDGTDAAYVLHASGRWREAGEAWAAIGCPYQQAAALADSDREDDLRASLSILQSLDARVLAGRVARRLRELGAQRIPRGPRATTRANPAGLSSRELEVLLLVCEGARNADIAERLVLAPKTVDHHVSAILRKLGVADRDAARREAERLGLQDGGLDRPS